MCTQDRLRLLMLDLGQARGPGGILHGAGLEGRMVAPRQQRSTFPPGDAAHVDAPRQRLPPRRWLPAPAWPCAGAPVILPILDPATSQKRCRLLVDSFFSRTSLTSLDPWRAMTAMSLVESLRGSTGPAGRGQGEASGRPAVVRSRSPGLSRSHLGQRI